MSNYSVLPTSIHGTDNIFGYIHYFVPVGIKVLFDDTPQRR